MRRRRPLLLLVLVASGWSGAGWAQSPPPTVLVAQVQVQDVAPVYSYIGRVQAIQSVQVVPRVTAFIEQEPTPQGSEVKAGQVLFQLQQTQYQAALQSAQAQLASATAALRNSQLQYERSSQLGAQGFEAQSKLDQATATRDQDQASVQAAQAAVMQAALNLSYCTITSPIGGRVGVYTLTTGNLVTPSTPALTTVNQQDPIRVVFSVSDRDLVRAQQRAGATPEKLASQLTLQLLLPDGSTYQHAGSITFLNNQVDPQTGTVSVFADFPNPDRLLVPGGLVTVNLRRSTPERAPMVPVAAIQTDQTGHYVLVVGQDHKVAQRNVTLGRQIAQDNIVTKGLSGGEQVIVEGVQKIRPGEIVNAQPAPPPLPVPQTGSDEAG
jgi:membrane fusion protein, multidrug efflux system